MVIARNEDTAASRTEMCEMQLKLMFTSVADTYDLVNRVLTFGFDERWREACARESVSGRFIVDLCCGTGALSLKLLPNLGSESNLMGLDFNKQMLDRAAMKKDKYRQKRQHRNVHVSDGNGVVDLVFIVTDAAHLPLKDECIDDISISFSFRNLIYKNPKAMTYLREATRTLKNNGRFVCVETSQPSSSLVRAFFRFYCLRIVPLVGGLISGRKAAYKYLGKSAANFPLPQEIVVMLKKAGFRKATFKPLSLGIIALYVAKK
jgi:demethylmenaquinone methyltransferase/2-methoxy-6-polyprenyl-1,4-benzoquinol methylase